MYLTMNRFKVKPGGEEAFETIWKSRDSQLLEVPGFVSFHLLKGPAREGYRLYASHTLWASEAAFSALDPVGSVSRRPSRGRGTCRYLSRAAGA